MGNLSYLEARAGVVQVAHAESMFQDSDHDGLPDWQEALYGTDPNNPDTDGNGIPDGIQMTSPKTYAVLKESDSVYEEVNNIGSNVQNAPDPTSQLSLSPTFYPDTYSASDVVTTDNSTSSVMTYVANALLLLAQHADDGQSKPLDTINSWLKTDDATYTTQIKQMSADRKALAKKFIAISVPPNLITTHLQIANYLYDSGLALDDVLKTMYDPTAGFFAGANYANYESKYTKAVIALTQYANTHYAAK